MATKTALIELFGIWKARGVYCPVNFSYTGRLLTYQLDDTAPAMVVTDPTLLPILNAVADDLAGTPTAVVYDPPAGAHDHVTTREAVNPRLPELAWSALTAEAERPAVTVGFDDPANVVYTSGTTGPAKGVVQPYRWMAQYTFNLRMPLTRDDVIYNDLPPYHVGGAIATSRGRRGSAARWQCGTDSAPAISGAASPRAVRRRRSCST